MDQPDQFEGRFTAVTRVGDEVRRNVTPASPAVHALLTHLERGGFEGAPRFHGIDAQGRERLTFIPGATIDDASADIVSDNALPEVGRLIRRYHDAVAGFILPDGLAWYVPARTVIPGARLVCHNDLAPRNTIFRDGVPVALIDWDLAYEAPPVWDVAHAVWQFTPIVDDGRMSPDRRFARVAMLVDGYGLDTGDRARLAEVLVLRIDATATGIRRLAAAGHPLHAHFVADGVVDTIERARDWAAAHAAGIHTAVFPSSS